MSKNERQIQLAKRTVIVTNLNLKPEKHGEARVQRADLSLEVLLEEAELDQIVRTRWSDARKVLWDKDGEPQLLDLDKYFDVKLEAEGTAELTIVNGRKAIEFIDAKLKKIKIEPMLGAKATVRCQIRVDPSGYLEQLAQMCVDERCQFAFFGRGALPNEEQQQLDV